MKTRILLVLQTLSRTPFGFLFVLVFVAGGFVSCRQQEDPGVTTTTVVTSLPTSSSSSSTTSSSSSTTSSIGATTSVMTTTSTASSGGGGGGGGGGNPATTTSPPTTTTSIMSEDEVLIPEGFFTMGCQDLVCWGPDLCVEWCISEDELPAHNVMLDSFFIDTHEVTNEQFAEFLSSHGNVCNSFDPDNESVCYAPDETDELYDPVLYLDNGTWQAEPGFEDHPAVWITWYGAMEYCASLGKRLPTEAEWEKAARGGLEGTVYPWGDEASDCTRANFYYFEIVYSEPEGMTFSPRYCSEDLTAPVGSYDTNGYALYDMAGNVQEWTADWYDALYYETSVSDNPAGPDNGTKAVLRGGGWNLLDYDMRCAARNRQNRSQTNAYTGFRCAW